MMRAWLFFTCACALGCSSASFVVAEDQQQQISDDAGDVLELDSAGELDTAVPPAETRRDAAADAPSPPFDSSSPPPFDSSPSDSSSSDSSTSSDAAMRDSHFIDSDIDTATTPPDFGIETETGIGICSVDGDCKSPSNCCDKTKGTCGARLFPYLPCSGSS